MEKYLTTATECASAFVANPQVQWACAGIGALYVSTKVLSFVWYFLKLFIFGGTNVSAISYPENADFELTCLPFSTDPQIW